MSIPPPVAQSWVTTIIAIAGTLGVGAVVPIIVKSIVGKRGQAAKAGKVEAEAESIEAESLRDSIKALRERCNETDDQNTKMRANIVDLRVKVDECEEDRRELHRLHSANAKDLALALARIGKLEATLGIYERRLTQAGLKTTMEGT